MYRDKIYTVVAIIRIATVSGRGLLMALNYMSEENDLYFDNLSNILDQTTACIQSGASINPSFSTGLAGWGWFLEFLLTKGIIQDEDDADIKEIDEYLFRHLQNRLESSSPDIINGEIGIGHYFIKKNNITAVNIVIDYLAKNKKGSIDEFYWIRQSIDDFIPVIDFEMVHGNAGILAFLTKCYKSDISKAKCYDLMTGSVNFFLNNSQSMDNIGSFFPNIILEKNYRSGYNGFRESRLAWCYGDLIIWYCILNAANAVTDVNLQKTVIDALLSTISRKEISQTHIKDVSFCHGSSGVAYISEIMVYHQDQRL